MAALLFGLLPGISTAYAQKAKPSLAYRNPPTTNTGVRPKRQPLAPPATPVPSSVSPTTGPNGTMVALTGTGFTGATEVQFGSQPAAFSVISDTKILAVAAGVVSASAVNVSVTNSSGTGVSSAGLYTFTATAANSSAPIVFGIDPPDGPAGTRVTFVGAGFSGATAVDFGGVPGTSLTVTQDGELSVLAPAGTLGTQVPVTVTTPAGTSSGFGGSPGVFLYHTVSVNTSPALFFEQPNVGPAAGGYPVLIQGNNLDAVTAVKFGTTSSTHIDHLSDTQISAIAPAGTAGATVDVTASDSGGTTPLVVGDHFTYAAPPTVTGVSPNNGLPGTSVTITGTGFTSLPGFLSSGLFGNGCLVSFGSLCASSDHITSSTQISALVPTGVAGVVDVTVTTVNGTSAISSADQFTVQAPVPVVSGVFPSSGPTSGGTSVSIIGSGFTGETVVDFGATAATVTSVADTFIQATAPAHAAGAVTVSVTTPGGTGTSSSPLYTYAAAPTITSVSPATGPPSGGTAVTVTGTNFVAVSQVTFGPSPGAPATFTTLSSTQLSVSVPPGMGGATVHITVTAAGGVSANTAADQFTYSAGLPGVGSVFPGAGPAAGGTNVTVVGNGFGPGTTVKFGANSGTSVQVFSADVLTVVAPAGTAGSSVDVTVTNTAGTSPTNPDDRFTYLAAPTVTGVSPSSGPMGGGTTVTITGTGFNQVTAVSFGGTVLHFPQIAIESGSTITATAPAGVAAGAVHVTVTAAGGTSATSSADQYTYVAQAPQVTAVTVNGGLAIGPVGGGTTVIISGAGFAGATEVDFGTTAAHFVLAPPPCCGPGLSQAAQIQATAPPAASAGTVDVTVKNAAGTSAVSGADKFTYAAAPVVTSISPSTGPAAGGTLVTITGSGFSVCENSTFVFGSGCLVNFGSLGQGQSLVAFDDSTLTVLSPAGPAGTVAELTVTTPVGTSAAVPADRFTYGSATAPTVTFVGSPGQAGGSAEIIGTGFTTATAVHFGAVAATFAAQSDTLLFATIPAGSAGSTVDVTVTNAVGTSAINPSDQFTYATGVPTVTGLSPSSGPDAGGTVVTVTGTNLANATSVFFGGVAAQILGGTTTSVTVVAPVGSPGTVDVTVATTAGFSPVAAADHYTYTLAAPAISSVAPNQGPATGGTSVNIAGSGLQAITAVAFGGTASPSFLVNPGGFGAPASITAMAPAHSGGGSGTVDVTVTNATGTSPTSGADQFTYSAGGPPAVSGVSPSSGPAAGGTLVTITGTGFQPGDQVAFGQFGFGGAFAQSTVNSGTSITALSPAGQPGQTEDVLIFPPNGFGSSASTVGDQFTYTGSVTPVVTSIDSSSGPAVGGTTFNIHGSNLGQATAVKFGTSPALSYSTSLDGTEIQVTSPPQGGNPATVDITVVAGGVTSATSASDQFTWVPAPTITNVVASSGPEAGGNSVTISGTNLASATSVTFGDASGTITNTTATSVTVTVPAHAPGPVDVAVTAPGGMTRSANAYTYTAAAPTVTAVSPNGGSVSGGGLVTVTGTNLFSASVVDFGSTPGTITQIATGGTSLVVAAPGGTAGTTVDVTVTTPGGTSATSNADKYTFQAVPTVTSLSVTSGPTAGGNAVTVNGTGLSNVTAVYFGTILARPGNTNSSGNGSSVNVIAPSHPAGTVDVTVITPGGTSAISQPADQYTFASGAPVVTSINPNSGPTGGGTLVQVSGGGFFGVTSVHFGAGAATPAFVSSDGSYLFVPAPAGTAGPVHVTVITSSGTSATSNADQYTYLAPPVLPVVTGLSTHSCTTAGGQTVTISGSGFTGVLWVSIGNETVNPNPGGTDTSLTVTCPPEGTGTVDVTVVTGTGPSAVNPATDQITFTAVAPAITSPVSPNSGPTAGGTTVFISGTSFFGVTAVDFGAVPGTVTGLSSAFLQVTAPAEAAGTVDIRVVSSNGTSAVTQPNDQFTFVPPPTLTSLSANTGDADGGTSVTITGNNFNGATEVLFGTVPTFPTINSNTSISVTSPAQAPATVDVTVVTPGGTSAIVRPNDQFTYTLAAPTVTGLSPTGGPLGGGNSVTVFGTDLWNVSSVTFGGTPGTGAMPSGTSLTVTAPAHAAGTVDVVVTTSAGSTPISTNDRYTYAAPATVTSFSPTTGPSSGGTPVTITGTGFNACNTGAGCSVTFGGNQAVINANAANGDTTLSVTSPGHAAGAVNVVVNNLGGPVTASQQFTYTATAPTVTAINFSSAGDQTGTPNGGDSVQVQGTALFGVTSVQFGSTPATVTSTDPSGGSVFVTEPAGTNNTTVHVTVTAEGGTSSTGPADRFTWLAPIIRQFRLSGPGGAGDQYIELYNPSTSLSVPLFNYSLNFSGNSGSPLFLSGSNLGPRQTYLIAGPAYSLGAVATADQTLASAIPEISGVQGTGGLDLVDDNFAPLEAVGFTGATGFFSGTALTAPATPTADYAFSRIESNGAPTDTGNNASDFQLLDPTGAMTGSVDGVPAPANSTSPAWNNLDSWSTLIDTSVSSTASPNMSFDSATHTLTIDRTIRNCSGGVSPCPTSSATTFHSMQLYISTMSVTGQGVAGQVQMDVQNSTGASVGTTCCGSVSAQGLTMVQSDGGGIGTLLQVPLPDTGGTLAPGDSVSVIFTFHVTGTGKFYFGYDVLTN